MVSKSRMMAGVEVYELRSSTELPRGRLAQAEGLP
jgi:hypothetical protein